MMWNFLDKFISIDNYEYLIATFVEDRYKDCEGPCLECFEQLYKCTICKETFL